MQNNIQNMLSGLTFFSALDGSELKELAALAVERSFAGNSAVFWEGDPSEWLYIVSSGKIKVTKLASTGKEIIIAFFNTGEMFGEAALFEDKPYPASAQTVEETRLIGIRKADFLAYLKDHPDVTVKIIGILSGRLRDAQNRLRDLAGERVEQRLARMLLMLSEKLGTTLPFTRQELSDMSGTTTETAIRILSQWKERGITDSVRGKIIISDLTKLKLLAEGPPDPV
jgi:CRP/FNR family transcriptional regulator, nitrogen oxide reductase regulator